MKYADPEFILASMPDVTALGAYPVLQFFAGLVVLLIGVWAFAAGQRNKVAPPPAPVPEVSRMFLDGPLIKALECMQDMVVILRRIEEGQHAAARELDKSSRDATVRNQELLAEISLKLSELLTVKDRSRR